MSLIDKFFKLYPALAINWNTGILKRWNDGLSCTAMLSVS